MTQTVYKQLIRAAVMYLNTYENYILTFTKQKCSTLLKSCCGHFLKTKNQTYMTASTIYIKMLKIN